MNHRLCKDTPPPVPTWDGVERRSYPQRRQGGRARELGRRDPRNTWDDRTQPRIPIAGGRQGYLVGEGPHMVPLSRPPAGDYGNVTLRAIRPDEVDAFLASPIVSLGAPASPIALRAKLETPRPETKFPLTGVADLATLEGDECHCPSCTTLGRG